MAHRARKRFGQNFLVDDSVVIVRARVDRSDDDGVRLIALEVTQPDLEIVIVVGQEICLVYPRERLGLGILEEARRPHRERVFGVSEIEGEFLLQFI